MQEWWSKFLDGEHAWGWFDVALGRYGFRRYRLTVYPPDINAVDRRLLRLWRAWPVGGGVVWLCAAMCLSASAFSPAMTFAVSTSVYVGAGAGLFALTGAIRTRVRSVSVMLIKGHKFPIEPDREAARKAWQKLTGVMLAAEDMLQRGTLSPVEYEAVWWEVYDRMEALADS